MISLGKNIKSLRKTYNYSQTDLANLIGVSQTSVAHYEAGTRQPTIETLMILSQLFQKPIDELVGHLHSTKMLVNKTYEVSDEKLIDLLVTLLVEKNEDEFHEVFEELIYPNFKLIDIADQLLKKVMYKIGSLWERGDITEADEHYATNIIRRSMNYISFKERKRIRTKKAISFIVGTESHSLGLEMVNTYLETQGIDVLYLGSNLPVRSIDKMIEENHPDYIFMSITMPENMNTLEYLVDYINTRFKHNITLGIGGQGVSKNSKLKEIDNVHYLRDINDVKSLINII